MKKTRKLISLLMALAMIFALAIPAFAADSGTYTITVTGNAGETYTAYKILDATVSEDGKNVSYTIAGNSVWYKIVAADGSPFTVTASASNPDTYVVTVKNEYSTYTDEQLANVIATYFANVTLPSGATYADEKTLETGETVTLDVSDSGAGYYYVTTTTGTVVNLTSASPTATIKDKNSEPKVEKEETTDGTAGIGDKVEYKATITAAEDVITLVYHDVMSEGLSFNNDVAIGGMTEETDYTVVTGEELKDGCTFEVEFTDAGLDKITTSAQEVVITYSATVNADAVTVDALSNTASLSYGNNSTSEQSQTETYTYGISIFKYTGTDTALPDAEFQLSKTVEENGQNVTYYAMVSEGVLTGWTTKESEATTLTSNSEGKITVDGLDAGKYTLTETKAPSGYNLLTSSITIDITDENKDGIAVVSYTYGNVEGNGEIKVLNNAGSELPSTGGMGTTLFYIFGGALVLCAVVLLVTRRRMDNEQ